MELENQLGRSLELECLLINQPTWPKKLYKAQYRMNKEVSFLINEDDACGK